jgi:predicted nuclease of predicted toxin-antitoxin system
LKSIFIDECVDWRLVRSLTAHQAKTARQMGWSELKNGTLLREASQQFEIFITTDKGIKHQNNIIAIDIAVIILRPLKNQLSNLLPLVPRLLEIIEIAQPRTVTYVPDET